jgi:anti-sigma regulatory factor (Ser/Thr protein kinase)
VTGISGPAAPERGGDTARLVLAPGPQAVRKARAFVRQCCEAGDLVSEACDIVVLLTSETVTNAFTHGRSEARLAVTAHPDRVLVEVADDNSRHPQAAEPDADALDGRGISILAMLATSWGVHDDPYGKTVWFEVANRLPERPTRPVDATTGATGEPQAGPLSRY